MRIAEFRSIGEGGETIATTFDFWGQFLGQKIWGSEYWGHASTSSLTTCELHILGCLGKELV